MFRHGIKGYFSDYKDREVNSTVKLDTAAASVHESLAISSKETGKKLFTINLFNTTSKVTANGSQLRLFLEEDLDCILGKINQNEALNYINSQIKDVCHKYLAKNSNRGATKGASRLLLDSIDNSVQTKVKLIISPPKKLKLVSINMENLNTNAMFLEN